MVAVYILYEAYQRFKTPTEIESTGMLIVAVIGLVVNLVSMRLLMSASDESLNVKGAYLEVWSDMLGSIGVIGAALIIRFTGWTWVDAIVAAAIGLWVLPRTWILLKESMNILLQGVPEGIDIAEVELRIRAVEGVEDIHDLHIWALTSGRNVMSAHLVVQRFSRTEQEILAEVTHLMSEVFHISHTTLQLENSQFHEGLEENEGLQH